MKKTLLFLVAASLYLGGCYQDHKAADMLKNEIQKKEIFSAIVNDDQLSSAMMDSLMNRHSEKMMSMMHSMMKDDQKMQMGMMNQMMEMADKDTTMCGNMMQMMMQKPNLKIQLEKAVSAPTAVQDKLDHTKHHPAIKK